MEFRNRRRSRGFKSPLNDAYPNRLQLYRVPPTEEISLEEFERFAVDRLKAGMALENLHTSDLMKDIWKVLREVEMNGIRFPKGSDNYDKKMQSIVKGFLGDDFIPGYLNRDGDIVEVTPPKFGSITEGASQASMRRKDHISHFILRLAFSRSEDLRRWFLSQEVDLFRYRFQQESSSDTTEFLAVNKLHYKPISKEEVKTKKTQLKDATFDATEERVLQTDYFKVHFTEAIDLVKNRKVYLEKGYAYIPRQELVFIIGNVFRMQLSQTLTSMSQKLHHLEEDSRLFPMLKALSNAYIGETFTVKDSGSKVTADQIESLSKVNFPMCMRSLQESLRADHHLRHSGRLQYGLFLKSIGLSLEEALVFWRKEFTKIMDVDKFEKQYAYNVRHSYGKEGKRADYTPYSCMKIITSNAPGPGDHHGCPFKHYDTEQLITRLRSYKIPKQTITEIVTLVKDQHYQVACTKYFEVTHNVSELATMGINHPTQYFNESVRILKNVEINTSNTKVKREVTEEKPVNQVNKEKVGGNDFDVEMEDLSQEDLDALDM